jgi:Zn finger protein HypA/HybF involved in hydrogenase expression
VSELGARALWLDGNALAGLLADVFETEMTMAERRCQTCGARSALGAHRAYRGAGVVLRCPVCGDIAMRIGILPDRHIVSITGELTLQAPNR